MKIFGHEITQRKKPGEPPPVTAESNVDGFTVSMEKKKGTLLRYPSKGGAPASADEYYELQARPTGTNPEYPNSDKAMAVCFTVGLAKGWQGVIEDITYIPAGSRYTGFDVVEIYDDGKMTGSRVGRPMPPHHTVMLRAHYMTAEGRAEKMAVGGWVRKSECERPGWKAAAAGPIMCP